MDTGTFFTIITIVISIACSLNRVLNIWEYKVKNTPRIKRNQKLYEDLENKDFL